MEERFWQARLYHALNLLPSLGPVKFQHLLRALGEVQAVWNASEKDIRSVEGIGKAGAELFMAERHKIDPDKVWKKVQESGCKVVTMEDPAYPPQLLQIYDPPLLLYYYGNLDILHSCCFSIVGSRRHTAYGKELAYKFSEELAFQGQSIVSGMARGIDTWVHESVLESGGLTAAVLGCGVDICYPPEHKGLKAGIEQNGILLSEFPPGSRPLPGNFPRRNRVISGLSWGTLVIEAGERSGALITAEFALEQGREVFAVPGSIVSPYSRGCHRLIKDGAKLVESTGDILEDLPFHLQEITDPAGGEQLSLVQENLPYPIELGEEERCLLETIGYDPVLLEEVIRLSKLPSSQVNVILFNLEIKGLVRQLPGKYYVKLRQ